MIDIASPLLQKYKIQKIFVAVLQISKEILFIFVREVLRKQTIAPFPLGIHLNANRWFKIG